MSKKTFSIFLIFFLSIGIAYSATFPNYSLENKYVTDTVGVLSQNEKSQITSLCAGIEQSTGAQIAVVIIKTTEDMAIEEYAVKLFEHWGIGEKDKDNGLLILVAIEDKNYRIEVGYGLEGILNDAKVGRLAREFFVDNFRQGKYGEGIYLAVETIGREIGGEETIISGEVGEDYVEVDFFVVLIFVLIPMMFLAIIAAIDHKRGRKNSFAKMMLWFLIFSLLGRGRGRIGGGGFGGFGGGRSGGGGASGGW